MTIEDVLRRIGEIGIVPVVRAASFDEANRAVEAICAGGIPIIEVTMTVPNATTLIRELVRRHGSHVLTGAGTVLTAECAKECVDAGAEFVVSPGFSLPVLRAVKEREKLCIPGALTPTEVISAHGYGINVLKIFPCGNVGGPKYIKALKAPLPQVDMIPTGGVNLSNAADYIAAGAFALGVGADLVDVSAIRNGNSQKIEGEARKLVEVVRQARLAASQAKRSVPARD
jgi:2-dehydro-3-deoxyphosphogluconate aldolase / (4S)-4-hydroxy-2-oxoglutarate aldolase